MRGSFVIEAVPPLPVGLVRYDGFRAAILEPCAQIITIIGSVTEKLFCSFGPVNEVLGNGTIVRSSWRKTMQCGGSC
jgi:hypothetical protein